MCSQFTQNNPHIVIVKTIAYSACTSFNNLLSKTLPKLISRQADTGMGAIILWNFSQI